MAKDNQTLDLETGDQLSGPVTCLGMEFKTDEARRVYFTDQLREKLKELRVQHRELDLDITSLETRAYLDHLELRRLKKRKLALKEMIVKLESELIPDLNA